MTVPKKTTRFDLYQEVTNKMIALLEKGVSPWKRTWNQYGAAKNYATDHVYTGINAFLMNLTPHPIPFFISYKQTKAKGGNIRKGAKAERVYFYKILHKNEDGKMVNAEQANQLRSNGQEVQNIPMLKYYNVFNIEDVEGIEIDIPQIELKAHKRIEKCEAIIKNMQNPPEFVFEDANSAYYSPSDDKLNMPDIAQFEKAENYYSTFFHELTHATGHKSRLDRKGITKLNPFGSAGYSKEELIAEMGASFLCAKVGIDYNELTKNSAAYIQGWLKVLKADKKMVFKAAAAAQRAVDFILDKENLKA